MPTFKEDDLVFRETYGDAPGWSMAEKEAPKGYGAPNRTAMSESSKQRRNVLQRPVGLTPIQVR